MRASFPLLHVLPLLVAWILASPAHAGDVLTTSPTTAPALSIAVNGRGDAKVYRGWPVIVEVTSVGLDAGAAVSVIVRDAQAKGVDWPLQPAAAPTTQPAGDPSGIRTASWIMNGGQSTSLADGEYEVTAVAYLGEQVLAESVP